MAPGAPAEEVTVPGSLERDTVTKYMAAALMCIGQRLCGPNSTYPVRDVTMTMMTALLVLCPCLVGAVSVGIVGAGIGGSALSYFLRERFGDDVDVTVFEASGRVGGRIREHRVEEGFVVEAGAAIGIKRNRYFFELSERLGFQAGPPNVDEGDFAVFNGKQFVFQSSSSSYLTTVWRLVRRYGLSMVTAQDLVRRMATDFDLIYDIQAAGQAFNTSKSMWDALGLGPYAALRLNDSLASEAPWYAPMSGAFVDEFVAAVTRINYNQAPTTISALAGGIALAPIVTDQVFSITGGK